MNVSYPAVKFMYNRCTIYLDSTVPTCHRYISSYCYLLIFFLLKRAIFCHEFDYSADYSACCYIATDLGSVSDFIDCALVAAKSRRFMRKTSRALIALIFRLTSLVCCQDVSRSSCSSPLSEWLVRVLFVFLNSLVHYCQLEECASHVRACSDWY